MYTLAIILMWIVSHFIFVILHEIGHVLMSRILFSDKNWWIELGIGAPVVCTKRLVINTHFYMFGFAHFTQHDGARWRRILRLAGGFITNTLCAGLFLLLFWFFELRLEPYSPAAQYIYDFLGVAFFYNLFLIITSATPLKYSFTGGYSDGYRIWKLLRIKD